jgi:hypothetical protein
MIRTLFFFLSLSVSPVKADAPRCEVVGPRLDGVSVEICDGRVRSYTDASGNKLVPGDWR